LTAVTFFTSFPLTHTMVTFFVAAAIVIIMTLDGAARNWLSPSCDIETKHRPGATKISSDSETKQIFSVLETAVTDNAEVAEILKGSTDFVMFTAVGRFQIPIDWLDFVIAVALVDEGVGVGVGVDVMTLAPVQI